MVELESYEDLHRRAREWFNNVNTETAIGQHFENKHDAEAFADFLTRCLYCISNGVRLGDDRVDDGQRRQV